MVIHSRSLLAYILQDLLLLLLLPPASIHPFLLHARSASPRLSAGVPRPQSLSTPPGAGSASVHFHLRLLFSSSFQVASASLTLTLETSAFLLQRSLKLACQAIHRPSTLLWQRTELILQPLLPLPLPLSSAPEKRLSPPAASTPDRTVQTYHPHSSAVTIAAVHPFQSSQQGLLSHPAHDVPLSCNAS